MNLEHFIYYRVAATPSLRAQMLALQAGLRRRHPGLQARLLRRTDGDRETWMEIYVHPGGVGAPLLAEIETLATPLLAGRLVGARRIESFEPCAS